MLIEFRVSNFRSIRDEQTFSMVASTGKELEETHTFEAKGFSNGKLLNSAAIYGANASGKTNLILSFTVMRNVVLGSALDKHRGDSLPVYPFKLDPAMPGKPTEFEVTFISGGVRYQYGFSATEERIVSEWLLAFPEGRTQRWFEREWVKDKYKWRLGTLLKGEKKLWQTSTRDNALFLSTAVHLNSEQLQPVYDWFRYVLVDIDFGGWSKNFALSFLDNKKTKDLILGFLNRADLGIDDIKLETEQNDPDKLPEDVRDTSRKALSESIPKVKTFRQNSKGELVEFDIADESSGTQKMLFLAGPIIANMAKGHVMFIDELHNSLHPELVKLLVGLFNNKMSNPNNAQLVFTTHETGMLSQELFRRDQIWFCEKGEDQATKLYPLSDFRPRKDVTNIESAYLSGRYGALPFFAED